MRTVTVFPLSSGIQKHCLRRVYSGAGEVLESEPVSLAQIVSNPELGHAEESTP